MERINFNFIFLLSLSFILILVSPLYLVAQEVTFPSKLQTDIDKSQTSFENTPLYFPVFLDNLPIVEEDYTVFENEFGKKGIHYKDRETYEVKSLRIKALAFLEKGNLKRTQNVLLQILEKDPEHFLAMIYIGKIYQSKGELGQAIKWNLNAIEVNPYSYLAHYEIGRLSQQMGKSNLAFTHLLKAHLLNKNDPSIVNHLLAFCLKEDISPEWWTFNPQYEFERGEGGSIRVRANEPAWQAYGNAKGLWKYDEEYRQNKLTKSSANSCLIEEKESLLSALVAYDKPGNQLNQSLIHEMEVLKKAIDYNFIDQYIIYEIWLSEDPWYVYTLSDDEINKLMDYLQKLRFPCKGGSSVIGLN